MADDTPAQTDVDPHSEAAGGPGGPTRLAFIGMGVMGVPMARHLARAGHEVTVVEAQGRPGGRVHTLREPFTDELYAEAGAMFAGGPHVGRTRSRNRRAGSGTPTTARSWSSRSRGSTPARAPS